MLPSEALEIMNSHHTNTKPSSSSLKAPQPFRVKLYCTDEERQPATSFYPGSVPYQLIQSSWGEGDIASPAKCTQKSDESFHSNASDLYYSSNENDSDPEVLIAEGITVTGPSICFTVAPTNHDNKDSHTSNSISESSTVSDGVPSTPVAPYVNGLHTTPSDPCIANGVPNGNEYTYSRTESTSSLSQDAFQDGLSRHNSIDQQPSHCMQIQNYDNSSYMISTNVQQSNSLPCNNAFNGYADTSSQYSFSYPMNVYSNPPNTPSTIITNQGAQPVAQTNPNWSQQQSFDGSSNFPFAASPVCQNYAGNNEHGGLGTDTSWGNVCSPVMTPSPLSSYNINHNGTPVIMEQIHIQPPSMSPLPMTNQATTPVTAINVNSIVSQPTPCLASPTIPTTQSIQNELVNIAMRRVTNEIANELKSELRGVISQVEQGIEDNLRERANSFTSKDKKVEALKRRARTLSGHAIRLKRSDTKDESTSMNADEKSDSNDESSISDPILTSEKIDIGPHTKCTTAKGKKGSSCKDSNCCLVKRDDDKPPKDTETCKRPLKWHCPSKNILKPTLTVTFSE